MPNDNPKLNRTSGALAAEMDSWNYFNYFTEIEEYFWKKRGAHLLVSPLDWAIMEAWQRAGIPLEAALKGIDRAHESYQRSRRGAGKPLKSLAYCADAVLEAAEEQREAGAGATASPGNPAKAEPFPREELRRYFSANVQQLETAARNAATISQDLAARIYEVRASLEKCAAILDSPGILDLEDLERRLTILDDKLQVALMSHAPEESLLKVRREVDSQMSPYRRKMKADQAAAVERQYSQKRMLEEFGLPRLSLYYFS